MKKTLGANISRYRKAQHLTQYDLAKKLGISYQAVSKWETGQTTPDLYLLPAISAILNTSIDQLMGYSHLFHAGTAYNDKYNSEQYYWGVEPSDMCLKLLELMPPTKPLKVLDIGCGEGKDAVFLARCGYSVSAFDLSDTGIEKTKRLAESANVFVDAFKADILDFRLEEDFDILFSSGVLHYIPPELRKEIIQNYQENTTSNGLNLFNVFVEKSFIPAPPDEEDDAFPWKSGELLTLYHDWYIEDTSENVFECWSGGSPHKHAMDVLYARKMDI